jgi:hypothetical protein
MSLIFLVAFVLKFFAGEPLTGEYLSAWALFSIADSMWFDKLKWGGCKECQD